VTNVESRDKAGHTPVITRGPTIEEIQDELAQATVSPEHTPDIDALIWKRLPVK